MLKHISALKKIFHTRYLLSITCIRLGNHELMFGGKLDVGRRKDLFIFFWSSPMFGRKLDVGPLKMIPREAMHCLVFTPMLGRDVLNHYF